ncbi:bifunctional histidinol-phosphatase/imidazoleglycerol-phosphate dehydratase HisB [Aureitalea marina]|uniref:Histidine biosynthesis bifunctional protein HisB n=1 Tax=Aureitalea marina TaxID=930804 RepID=A0A2S7KPD1_9FLAO|nr:bifunctional histidinol-phosphatase/imidazoleglycerol-phosphate dehydratase HisB [Aureitalea marina]PQB04438.1 bifunctional imidazole glycerol-phosphate dehydratase/histidinol phosphatase [Aureitalea marina]
MKKKVLFIDRDGTLIRETADEQIDAFEKITFYPGMFQWLSAIVREGDYELVMVTNQDGLGTSSFPEDTFWPVHNFIMRSLENEGIAFDEVMIDRSFPEEGLDTRKPGTGLLTQYMNGEYDLDASYVIGDRMTDMELAHNLGCRGIFINDQTALGLSELEQDETALRQCIDLETTDWSAIYALVVGGARKASVARNTKETKINIDLDLDGHGSSKIDTGIAFFDHMLDQLSRHGGVDLNIHVEGDLEVDEHHTIEDTAIALGQCFKQALGNKLGIERYGYCLPMDDCLARVAIDFGGRSWLVWEADFKREMIGKMPTEMFLHFFKSFADGAEANINVQAEGTNEHHKIEAIFKAFAKSIKMAIKRDPNHMELPSTKGVL